MLPRGMSMLWESDDPNQALLERFGFHDLAETEEWLSSTIAELWGIEISTCLRLAISDHNAIAWVKGPDDRALIAKWSMHRSLFDRLHASTTVLSDLGKAGAPVAAPLRTRDGSVRVEATGPTGPLSMAVLPELAGHWLDTDDLHAVESAGAALAQIHRHLGDIADIPAPLSDRKASRDPDSDSTLPTDQLPSAADHLRVRISRWLEVGDLKYAPEASAQLSQLLDEAPELTDEPQLVHRDFRAANILTQGSEVAGILDFDDITVSYRVRDLAQASVYLSTRFRGWAPTPHAAQAALRAGYESVRQLGAAESDWFEVLLLWQSLGAIEGPDDTMGWIASANSLARQ